MSNPNVVIIVPAKVRASNVNIGTVEVPVMMDRPSGFWIPQMDKIILTEDLMYNDKLIASKGQQVTIRHIKNGTSPYLDIQKIIGEEPNISPRGDHIRVDDAVATYRNEGLQKSLFEYIQICNYNASNPNRIKNIEEVFKVMNTEKEAMEYVDMEVERFEALKLVWGLFDKRTKKYDDEKIEYYNTLLKLGGATIAEKFVNLEKAARSNPRGMMHIVDTSKGEILMHIDKAFKDGILYLSEYAVENTITKTVVVSSEKKMTMALAEEKLMVFYATEEGKPQYENIQKATKKKKQVLQEA